jgi:CTP synthase (UTP-ammonia lyase)
MKKEKKKFLLTAEFTKENIISAPDEKIIYKIPLNFERERLGEKILRSLGLPRMNADTNADETRIQMNRRVMRILNGLMRIKMNSVNPRSKSA